MMTSDTRLAALSSPDLLAALERTAAHGREVTADLIALLAECDARQLYAMPRPPRSRYIPAAIRRRVWDRDGARCAYVSSSGRRCTATAGLEFHHRIPFAEGGSSTVDNLLLACVRHNTLEARRWFNCDQAKSESTSREVGGV